MSASCVAILGIGEDGVEGLGAAARALIGQAALVVGGHRHLALAAPLIRGETLAWPQPMERAFDRILATRPAVVLASGDPFFFGIGPRLAALIQPAELVCIPAPSAFALACARLGWAQQETDRISFCGRPLAALVPLLQPGRKILALSAGAETPAAVVALLERRGFGPSRVRVLEALGGPRERIHNDVAGPCAALNLLAIEVVAGPDPKIIPLTAGLPDEAFEHDGQLTRREVRAVTLAALAPRRGERLWDVGAGAGSIAIEWMLCDPANTAIGLERDPDRAARALRNAAAIGVPGLDIRVGTAPAVLDELPRPDCVFIGGGATAEVLARCWDALPPGGRLVVNAVTIETAGLLAQARAAHGGSLVRIAIEHLDAIGHMHGFRPAMAVTQWAVQKPCCPHA